MTNLVQGLEKGSYRMLNFTIPRLLHWRWEGVWLRRPWGGTRAQPQAHGCGPEGERAGAVRTGAGVGVGVNPLSWTLSSFASRRCLPRWEKYDHRIRRVQVTSALSGCARTYRAMSPSREELIGTSSDRYLQLAGPTGHRCEVTARAAGGNLTVDIEGRRPWKVLKESWSAG